MEDHHLEIPKGLEQVANRHHLVGRTRSLDHSDAHTLPRVALEGPEHLEIACYLAHNLFQQPVRLDISQLFLPAGLDLARPSEYERVADQANVHAQNQDYLYLHLCSRRCDA
jgi:hypothetical protein